MYIVRVSLPGVTSGSQVSVNVVHGRAVEIGAENFQLTLALPFLLPGDASARRVKFSKKTQRLTLEFEKPETTPSDEKTSASTEPCELAIPGLLTPETERLVYVAVDEKKGRHLRARSALRAGSTVFTCYPITATTHDTRSGDTCSFCFKKCASECDASNSEPSPSTGVIQCVDCPTKYCSERCRHNDVAHAGECALVHRGVSDKKLGAATRGARMLLRLLYLRAMHPDKFKETDIWSASDETKTNENTLGACKFLRAVLPPTALPEASDLQDFIKKTRENLHGVVDHGGNHLGTGAYGIASLVNHDCAPNCVTSFLVGSGDEKSENVNTNGPCLVLRTVCDVEKHSELTVGYVELYASRGERRDRLRKTKGFHCLCLRCENSSDKNTSDDAKLIGWRCAERNCPGVATHDCFESSLDDSSLDTILKCGTCGSAARNGPEDMSKRDASVAETKWRAAIDASREASRSGDYSSAASIASETLAECTPYLHVDHYIQHELRLALTEASVTCEDYQVVIDTTRVTITSLAKKRFFLNGCHPGAADAKGTLADALENIANGDDSYSNNKRLSLDQALVNRVAVVEILSVAYGEGHAATKRARAKVRETEGLLKLL